LRGIRGVRDGGGRGPGGCALASWRAGGILVDE
jgi:hypothetical protein